MSKNVGWLFSETPCMLMILLYSKFDQASDLWQQLELASELESDQRTVDWGREWLVDFNAGKTQMWPVLLM